ncbi:MAG: Rrf2 family transcriptional regulator [Clostridia bacterium]|nr:Rrf2 family transcriptional regulator [Clostridia bacterium]
MLISTTGRYALRVMLDLAQHETDGFISLRDVAERQHISMKYLEMITGCLNRAGLVRSLRGKNGGYCLAVPADQCTVSAVVRATEGSLTPVKCPACEGSTCEQSDGCYTLPVWQKLDQIVEEYLSSVTLADLLKNGEKPPITGAGACQNERENE